MKKLFYTSRDGARLTVLYYAANENFPLLLEVHGGGFKYGSAAANENLCRRLCEENGVNVASVEYRLAPKVKYPVATEDCIDALRALIADGNLGFDRSKIALIGHSAGANIVAGMSFTLKDENYILGQLLICPFLDVTQNKRKYVFTSFTRLQLKLTNDAYFPDRKRRGEITASPLAASNEDLNGLPPAFIFTAGIDTLAVDGVKYAEKLREAGVQCTHVHGNLARHGFFEDVPSLKINKWWWINKQSRAEQIRCYDGVHMEIKKFLSRIFLDK